jgi:hypothetical protein
LIGTWNILPCVCFSRIHIVSEERANQFFPEKVDRFMGNAEGWNASFDFISHDEGAATHVVAAFEIDIASKSTSAGRGFIKSANIDRAKWRLSREGQSRGE